MKPRQGQNPKQNITVSLHKLHEGQKRIADSDARFRVVMCGRRFGKALALDTPIPTPSGWTTMGEIKEGDQVYDENGKICSVVGATDVMYNRECYRVVFSDDTEIIADAEHQWLTWDRRERKNHRRNSKRVLVRNWGPARNDKPKVRTTKEILDTIVANDRGDANHSITCTAPIEGVDVEWPIDPYVLGAWLGDGSSQGPKIYSDDQGVVDELAAAGELVKKTDRPYEYSLSDDRGGEVFHASGQRFYTRLKNLGLLNNKHIPEQYLRAHASDRLALLQGLMDTDGHITKKGHCEFTGVNKRLVDGVLDLCLGLGIRATLSEGDATINGRFISKKYRVKFTADIPVFRLKRKLERQYFGLRIRNTDHRFIVAVEPVPSVPVRCIAVDSPNHLYLCSRSYIATHNTALGISTVCKEAIAGKPVAWFAPQYKYALEAWRELAQRLGGVIERMNEQEKRIELITGGVIEVWTMDTPDPARGRKYSLVVIDEAGIVRDLLEIWQAAIRPTLVDLGGRALILGTPKGRRHGFVTMFNRGLREEEVDWQSFRASTLDNPFIPPEEIEAARKELPPEVFSQEFEGIPLDDGVNPFGLDAVRRSFKEVDGGPVVVWGVDLARAQDFTVAVGMDAWRRVVKLERWQAPWAITKERVAKLIGQTPAVVDATGVGDAIVADLQVDGAMVTGYVFTQPSKLRLMQRLIAAFQANEMELPKGHVNEWLQAELESFEFTYTNTGVRYEAPRGMTDDGVMALALALHGWDRVQGVPPDELSPFALDADDPYIESGVSRNQRVAGDFAEQLPASSW